MADFNIAFHLTLQHEGGFSENINDPGGATNMGITQKDLPGIDIRTLTLPAAMVYYQSQFWSSIYDQIDSQDVANKIFDMRVLFGPKEAIMLLQLILNIDMDGVFGPFTLAVVNAQAPKDLLLRYQQKLRAHAQNVVIAHPEESVFLQGWLNRINS